MTLEELREKLKAYNITKLAKIAGVPRHAIYRIAKGEGSPSYEHVTKLIKAFENA